MLKRIEKVLRHYWHDLYYFVTSKTGEEFAMTCKDVTEKIDLPDSRKTVMDKFRVFLHVSLCQACSNYKALTLALRQAIKKLISAQKYSDNDLKKLNQDLLKRFGNQK